MMPAKLPLSSVKGVLGRFVKPWIPPNVVFWMTTERLMRLDKTDQVGTLTFSSTVRHKSVVVARVQDDGHVLRKVIEERHRFGT
jgi:hypothetical protein